MTMESSSCWLWICAAKRAEIELCLRITNGNTALAHWIGDGETKVGLK